MMLDGCDGNRLHSRRERTEVGLCRIASRVDVAGGGDSGRGDGSWRQIWEGRMKDQATAIPKSVQLEHHETKVRTIEIQEGANAAKTAA